MNMFSSGFLEVTVISAEDLRLNHHSIKKNVSVIVQTDSNNRRSTSASTEGGSYPSWNEKLSLALTRDVRVVRVEVQCKTALDVKFVAAADIPVSDFMGEYMPMNYLHFLSYRLRDRDGKRNGIINLSVRMKVAEEYYVGVRNKQPSSSNSQSSCQGAANYRNSYGGGGPVMGIPVSYGCN